MLNCFKAYDVRGVIGESVSEEAFARIGKAMAKVLDQKNAVVGYDARESSPRLASAFTRGLRSEGVNVIDIGLSGTEEVYFATTYFNADGGAAITASHNPINYNGIKFVGPSSTPLDIESEFLLIKKEAEEINLEGTLVGEGGYAARSIEAKEAYAKKILDFVDVSVLKKLKVVINCGNGAAGPALKEVMRQLEDRGSKLEILPMFIEPDHSFPNGIPNPILIENHPATADIVRERSADIGIAFDGDFDRCFFFDSNGNFVPGEIVVGLLAEHFSKKQQPEKIVHDPRLVFNVRDICQQLGAVPVQSKTGHLFMKQVMRRENAAYGGEISAHHYFRDFFFCDSGMIPWLLVCELLSRSGQPLSALYQERKNKFPSSGELNFSVNNPKDVLREIEKIYGPDSKSVERSDGLSYLFEDWRFNVRSSNTEPLVRLNIETQGNNILLSEKTAEITALIDNFERLEPNDTK